MGNKNLKNNNDNISAIVQRYKETMLEIKNDLKNILDEEKIEELKSNVSLEEQ